MLSSEIPSFETISFKIENEYIGFLTINRPEKLNALNDQVFNELNSLLDLDIIDELRVLIITGSGKKSFVAGADISELIGLSQKDAQKVSKKGQQVFSKIENLSIPVIAAVNGFALGGGLELAMACSFRIASENARFGLPEVKLGLIPGYGGTQRLSTLVGIGNAIELITSAAMISAIEAKEIGLVNRVVPLDDLIDKCYEIANNISANAPLAVKAALNTTRLSMNGTDFDAEARIFSTLFETDDAKEGIEAFLSKRSPSFNGN